MRWHTKTAGLSAVLAAPATVVLLTAVLVHAQTSSPCESETVVPVGQDALRADCEVLWDFYTHLEDPGTLDDAAEGQWGSSNALSSWRGVTIDPESGLVSKLYLYSSGLTGPISPELGRLTALESLVLRANDLSGSIPSELGQLTGLSRLNLSENRLSGSIPVELAQLTELTSLGLSSNELTGSIPSELGQLSNLRFLVLDYNYGMSGSVPSELGQLSNLRQLWLGNNDLSGSIPSELGQLTRLRELYLGGNNLSGTFPSGLSRFDPYSRGPMGLLIGNERHLQFTLSSESWDVFLCDTPDGDLVYEPDETIALLNREVTPYYSWLSNDRYQPRFRYAGRVEGPHLQDCYQKVYSRYANVNNRFGIIGDVDDRAGLGGPGPSGHFDSNGLRVKTIIHEIGHALGFPHSYGGLIKRTADVRAGGRLQHRAGGTYEYDNPMDIMSGAESIIGMIAVHRYAAGWIDPANVAIHPAGKVHTYELRPPGSGGTQMLVLRDYQLGVMIALGARVAEGYDSDIPKEGVEAYKVDQLNAVGLRRIQQIPAPESYDDDSLKHVHSVGAVFKVGTATVEVVERVGGNFRVRVVDAAEPVFAGRFSDEDGSAHEGNIEAIAARGVTLGCSPTYPDRFCPDRVVTRAQMMAFLARALGIADGAATLTSRFADVSAGSWYSSYLERLADLGVAEPYEDGTFRPSEPLTRSDMAVFLTRAFSHISAVSEPTGAFEDVPADAAYAAEVEAILAAEVTRGCSSEPIRYCPEESVTRAQMASFLTRALESAP